MYEPPLTRDRCPQTYAPAGGARSHARARFEALPDWLAYLAETDEVVDQTYARRMAAEEAAPRPKLSLVGCMDAPEYEFNFMDSLKQKPEECERAARTCRAHAE